MGTQSLLLLNIIFIKTNFNIWFIKTYRKIKYRTQILEAEDPKTPTKL